MLDGRLNSVEHARLLIGAGPELTKSSIERVSVLRAILQPCDALSK
jgi:hypothetical protein